MRRVRGRSYIPLSPYIFCCFHTQGSRDQAPWEVKPHGMVLTKKKNLEKCFPLDAKIFSKVNSSCRKNSTGEGFLRWDVMSEGLQKRSQLEKSDPAKTKRDVFHRGCFAKTIS